MNSNQPPALSPEIIDDLRNRYGEPEIPKCSICGGELSVQRSGGGSPTIWACSGMIDDPTGERNWIYAEGRSMADAHYERSRWTDYRRGGDSDVIELIEAYQALIAQPVSQRYKLPELNEELINILGRPNFTCSYAAMILRKGGMEIKRKSEHEQAAVIHFLLGHYLEHGDRWFVESDKELIEMAEAAEKK